MTEQKRLQIRAELAQMMGWQHLAKCHRHDDESCWKPPEDDTANWLHWSEPPDPFINAADNRALVEWLATDDERWERFLDEFQITAGWQYWLWQPTLIKVIMTAPLDTITLAAAKALGIQGNREYTLLKEAEATGRI